MSRLIIIFFVLLITFQTHARNFALIAGGSDYEHEEYEEYGLPIDTNQFVEGMSKLANGLQNKGWETTVLFDSDYKPSEWNQFNSLLRPNKPGEKSGHFSLENFEKYIDDLINKKGAKSGDQVEIHLNIHGGVLGNRHFIGWEDTRGKSGFSTLASIMTDLFNPTKEIAPKIQQLLEKGIQVHLSTGSCHDGQILKDLEPLVNQFPNLLCITTATMSDRSANALYDEKILNQLISTSSPSSIFEIFKKYQYGYNQISSLSKWMNEQEKVIPTNKDPSKVKLTSEQNGQAMCSLSHLLFSLPLSKNQLAFITNGSVLPLTQDQLDCKKLKEMCSDKYNAKLSEKYESDIKSLTKKYEQKALILSPQIVPDLFVKRDNMYALETSQVGVGVSSGSGKLYVYVEDLANFYLQDMTKLSPREKKGMDQLYAVVNKDKKLKDSVLGFTREIAELKKNYDKLKCNERTLNDSLIRLKQSLMDNIADKPEASACKNFKI